MKKYTLTFLLLLVFAFGVLAQTRTYNMPHYDAKRFHFGYLIGYNFANFAIRPQTNLNTYDSLMEIETSGMSGFDIGIVINLRVWEYLDFRFVPHISLIDRKVDYAIGNTQESTWVSKNIESVYLNLPLVFKLKSSRMNNFRFYSIFGAQYGFDMATRSKKRNPVNDIMLKLKASDLQVIAGVGTDFYLESFKLALEFRMVYGVINILKPEDNFFANSVERLSTKTFQFSILFE
ncbi:MAG: PorT family protein [Bacteroidales bacterium]|nr:PorT family protein [Bacteroidales bacterium]